MFVFLSLLFIVTAAYGQDCDQTITLTAENKHELVRTPDNPDGDPSDMTCNWTVESPENTRIHFGCRHDEDESKCGNEIVVTEGEDKTSTFCRNNYFYHVSVGNSLKVTYTTPPDSQDGYQLICFFGAVGDESSVMPNQE